MENHNQKSLNECSEKNLNTSVDQASLHQNEKCSEYKNEFQPDELGRSNLKDPMQTGQIVNDPKSFDAIYRYSKSLRGTDTAVMDLFKNLVVIDDEGHSHKVPVIWGTQEKAVAAIIQDNVRKDNSLVVDRIRLPMLAITSTDYQFNQARYVYHRAVDYLRGPDGKPGFTHSEKYERDTIFGVAKGIPIDISYSLYAWTMYVEDMNQILEQIILKFSPVAYIKVRGVNWEVQVKLDSIANNLEYEPGDQAIRVVKFMFNLTAETYIPQPIVRRKSILSTKVDFTNNKSGDDLEIISSIEETVKEVAC
jgi:hypothetical protein